MGTTPQDPSSYVVKAGREGPYRFFSSDNSAVHYSVLAAVSLFLGWMVARVDPRFGLVLTTLLVAAVVAAAILLHFAAWDLYEWWRGEVHFRVEGDALLMWYGTERLRAPVRRLKRDAEVVALFAPTQIPTLTLVSAGKRFTLGRTRDVYPREFERWADWAGRMGWSVDASQLAVGQAEFAAPIVVGAEWTVLELPGDPGSVWIVPDGPSSASYLAETRDDWLPEENVDELGESFAPVGAPQITSIALRVAPNLADAGDAVEFGSVAARAVVQCGGESADVDFEVGVDASSTAMADGGRLEVTFRRAR